MIWPYHKKGLTYLPFLRTTPSSVQPRFNTFPTAVKQKVKLQPKGRVPLSQSVDKENRLSKREDSFSKFFISSVWDIFTNSYQGKAMLPITKFIGKNLRTNLSAFQVHAVTSSSLPIPSWSQIFTKKTRKHKEKLKKNSIK